MIKIIEGKRYNTDTAEALCELPCTHHSGDFHWHETTLYRSPKGQYFLAGKGNAASMWAEPTGQNSMRGGSGLRLIDDSEAQNILEQAGEMERLEELFTIEDG